MCQYFLYYKALKAKQTRMSYNTTETQKKKKTSLDSRCDVKEISSLIWNTHVPFSPKWKQEKYYKIFFSCRNRNPLCTYRGWVWLCWWDMCKYEKIQFKLHHCVLFDYATLYSCMFLWKWTECRPNATSVVQFKRNSVILFLLCLVCWTDSAVKCNKMYFQFFLLFYSYLNS